MSQLVQPRLVNDPFGDPGLYLDFRHGRRALLFDLGDVSNLSPRELLRVSHVFVSHAHMDHVAGTDRLLRLRLHRPRSLEITGPPGFLDQMEHRLRAFTWNLLDADSVDFRLTVAEFDGHAQSRRALFRARDGFVRHELPPEALPPGTVLSDPDFEIRATMLDHGIPLLAFAFLERERLNVRREGVQALGHEIGPWLGRAKRLVREGRPPETPVEIGEGAALRLGDFEDRALIRGPGQRIAYVTDCADHAANRERIAALAQGADHLFIEAVFLEVDRDLAQATHHLTARAAGEIAVRAGAVRVTGFHHSMRYVGQDKTPAVELAGVVEAARATG
ncbi:MBL fold metallo-hydrolase [Limimaricola pyoseonensis]|uniref:Ribonuclease Z n=1 Tax=Limimaricola pyoseonensis TaxID=521013 RepID=A0A1G7CK70_9RHOB|nr:MBL fold metallo-hydrolase [Limimaricola pyoseonensis]SDE39742.1 ribonuclease Z [Limimaricola pyoseonensis]